MWEKEGQFDADVSGGYEAGGEIRSWECHAFRDKKETREIGLESPYCRTLLRPSPLLLLNKHG